MRIAHVGFDSWAVGGDWAVRWGGDCRHSPRCRTGLTIRRLSVIQGQNDMLHCRNLSVVLATLGLAAPRLPDRVVGVPVPSPHSVNGVGGLLA
jgi:hypothetical protein